MSDHRLNESGRCGRDDDHEPHWWGVYFWCDGKPAHGLPDTESEREARREGHSHDGHAAWCHPDCPLWIGLSDEEQARALERDS